MPGEFTNDIRQGFVYERVQHITLKSIANNPDIKEGMTPREIDVAIKRHADFECSTTSRTRTQKVRVAGPFTVESLSPHRSLAFGDGHGVARRDRGREGCGRAEFEQSILDNLAKAGIQNGRRQRSGSRSSRSRPTRAYIQAIGEQPANADDGAPTRIAIAIGPQYGTVSPAYVKKAAREAIHADDVDLLCILGFAFDPRSLV